MSLNNNAFQPVRYSGDIKIGHWTDADTFGGYHSDAVNFAELSITPDGDMILVRDTGTTNMGQARHVLHDPKPTKAGFQIDEFNLSLLADVIRGLVSTYSQTNASGQTAAVTLIKDRWVDVGVLNISTVTITDLVEGTDFKVDGTLGQVMALTDDAVGAQSVGFKKGAITGSKIVAGNNKPILLGLKGVVKDQQSGDTGILEIPKLAIDPKTALMICGGKGQQEGKFDGIVMVPPGNRALWTFLPTVTMTAPT